MWDSVTEKNLTKSMLTCWNMLRSRTLKIYTLHCHAIKKRLRVWFKCKATFSFWENYDGKNVIKFLKMCSFINLWSATQKEISQTQNEHHVNSQAAYFISPLFSNLHTWQMCSSYTHRSRINMITYLFTSQRKLDTVLVSCHSCKPDRESTYAFEPLKIHPATAPLRFQWINFIKKLLWGKPQWHIRGNRTALPYVLTSSIHRLSQGERRSSRF